MGVYDIYDNIMQYNTFYCQNRTYHSLSDRIHLKLKPKWKRKK